MSFRDKCLDDVIAREGAVFTDDPSDRGGATKYGVTLVVLGEYYALVLKKPKPSAGDLKSLDETAARTVLCWNAWTRYGLDKIPNADVAEVMFDCAVNHGGTGAIKLLQKALGVKADGVFGPVTLLAIPHLSGAKTALRILFERVRLQGAIIENDHRQAKWARGWANRSADMMGSFLSRLA